jgi:limonene-1,2-epoxide hydrolase
MPWFPDFVAAVELARQQTRAAGKADPVGQYVAALNRGDTHDLETVWSGQVVVYDPRAGLVKGHRHLRRLVKHSQSLLAERQARSEAVASIVTANRAVVEVSVHLLHDGQAQVWPVAVVAESRDQDSVEFRSYLSQWVLDGRRHLRPAILKPGSGHLDDGVGRYLEALEVGDTEAVVRTFARDGYYREPVGPPFVHRGADELRAFFGSCFSEGGGIALERCVVTEDGVRCALEYNCVRWGSHSLQPQAGLAVFERGPDGLLAGVRVYDDVEAPVRRP